MVSITERIINAPVDRVFGVLADGWTYSDWVVGTAHIRDVDPSWPSPGAKLYHKAGPWPVSIKDRTRSLECEPGRMLLLDVHLWPFGAAHVLFTLDPLDAQATRVTMQEHFVGGPMLGARNKVGDVVLHYRNAEALGRLADFAERRRSAVPA